MAEAAGKGRKMVLHRIAVQLLAAEVHCTAAVVDLHLQYSSRR